MQESTLNLPSGLGTPEATSESSDSIRLPCAVRSTSCFDRSVDTSAANYIKVAGK